MKQAFGLALALLFAGCATSYQPQGFGGGFSDVMTAPDSALVTFKGNGYTGSERVIQMALLRSAELTLQHGYRYFAVTGTNDISRSYLHVTTGDIATIHSGVKPGIVYSIRMANDKNALMPYEAYDATFLQQSLREHLGVKEYSKPTS
jgi:hypothetical protein